MDLDEVALEQIFLQISSLFLLLIFIPPLFHTHLSLPREVCNSPRQAAYYHILGLQVGNFISDSALIQLNWRVKLQKQQMALKRKLYV
jgi:hypothetical protein